MDDLSSHYAEIIPERLFFGDIEVAKNNFIINKLDIKAIVNLTDASNEHDNITYRCPIEDKPTTGIDWIEPSAKYIDEQLAIGVNVYIHCIAGISRSSTLAIYYLMTRYNKTLHEAYLFVLAKRPIIAPSIGFMQGLISIERNLYNCEPSITEMDYVIESCMKVFPTLEKNIIEKMYHEALEYKNDPKIIEKLLNKKDIYRYGYVLIDMLLEKYPSHYVKRKNTTKHHPFD